MKKFNIAIVLTILMLFTCGITNNELFAASAVKSQAPKASTASKPVASPAYTYSQVNALDMVKNPNAYLNKRVKVKAKFDKFSSLGLDYKPAMRSSEKYITFLIRRDDASNDIPLSELKNFMKREVAEKHIDLETDDVIEYSGLVFSNALGDVWLEVEDFKIISSKAKNSQKKTSAKTK